jgi:hypothetical protein
MKRSEIAIRLSEKIQWLLKTYLNDRVTQLNELVYTSGTYSLAPVATIRRDNAIPTDQLGDHQYPVVSVFASGETTSYDSVDTTSALTSSFEIIAVVKSQGYDRDTMMDAARAYAKVVQELLEEHLPDNETRNVCYKVDAGAVVGSNLTNKRLNMALATCQINVFSRADLLHRPTITPNVPTGPRISSQRTSDNVLIRYEDNLGSHIATVQTSDKVDLGASGAVVNFTIEQKLDDRDVIYVCNQTKWQKEEVTYDGTQYVISLPIVGGETLTISWVGQDGGPQSILVNL